MNYRIHPIAQLSITSRVVRDFHSRIGQKTTSAHHDVRDVDNNIITYVNSRRGPFGRRYNRFFRDVRTPRQRGRRDRSAAYKRSVRRRRRTRRRYYYNVFLRRRHTSREGGKGNDPLGAAGRSVSVTPAERFGRGGARGKKIKKKSK